MSPSSRAAASPQAAAGCAWRATTAAGGDAAVDPLGLFEQTTAVRDLIGREDIRNVKQHRWSPLNVMARSEPEGGLSRKDRGVPGL